MKRVNKKILFCATVDYHFKAFHLPYLKWFKDQGWEVHVAAYGGMQLPYVDKKYSIPIQRSPFHKMNVKAYKELKRIIDENQYKMIHCHTPMGGVLTRLAAREAREAGTKVLYTAHGFHFCNGAPIINWLVYYPIERTLSRLSDCLITINQEDFDRAVSHGFKAKEIKHVHGVGVNIDSYKPADQKEKLLLRKDYGYDKNHYIMFYAAEFNKNKNQKLLIEALAQMKDKVPTVRLLLAGEGPLLKECQELACKLGVDSLVDFLGYRNDIDKLLKISDIAVASSHREGLPLNIMEAMAVGLPVIATKNRGHLELVQDGINGFVIPIGDSRYFAKKLTEIYYSKELYRKMSNSSKQNIKQYSLNRVAKELIGIYSGYMAEEMNETKSKHNRAYI
jgi:glycosyltransferase EpsD